MGKPFTGAPAHLQQHLRNARAQGFDHAMLSTAEYDLWQTGLPWLAQCQQAGLGLLMHLPLAGAVPEGATLAALAAQGVAGFCLGLDNQAEPEFLSALIAGVKADVPQCRFVAWTAGLPTERRQKLQACGFDACVRCCTLEDLKAGPEETPASQPGYGAVIGLAAPDALTHSFTLATPTSPASEQALEPEPSAPGRHEMLLSLWLAALSGEGLLIPHALMHLLTEERQAADVATAPACQTGALHQALALSRDRSRAQRRRSWTLLSAPGAPVSVLRTCFSELDRDEELVFAVNVGDLAVRVDVAAAASRADGLALVGSWWPQGDAPEAGEPVLLQPCEARIFTARRTRPASWSRTDASLAWADAVARSPRVVIESVSPCMTGSCVVRRRVGDVFRIEADIHGQCGDSLKAVLRWRPADEGEWQETPLRQLPDDRWAAEVLLARTGRYYFELQAWADAFGAWCEAAESKHAAGLCHDRDVLAGRQLVQAALERCAKQRQEPLAASLAGVLTVLGDHLEPAQAVAYLVSQPVVRWMRQAAGRAGYSASPTFRVEAERRAASFASWYEPLSCTGPDHAPVTVADLMTRLPAIGRLGFDTLYLSGPLLRACARKPAGLTGLESLRNAAAHEGIELAMDFSLLCPLHPLLPQLASDVRAWTPAAPSPGDEACACTSEEPQPWARDTAPPGWLAWRDAVLFWAGQGVTVLCVHNLHEWPVVFWDWLIDQTRPHCSDLIFVAAPRPGACGVKPLRRLLASGFSQSVGPLLAAPGRPLLPRDLQKMEWIAEDRLREVLRPHLRVEVPALQADAAASPNTDALLVQLALAATLAGVWRLSADAALLGADGEAKAPGLRAAITLLNRLRSSNPALQTHQGVCFCPTSDESIVCFTKSFDMPEGAGRNVLLVAVRLDPAGAHACDVELPLATLRLPMKGPFAAEDLGSGERLLLKGSRQQLRLGLGKLPFLIWRFSGA